jgi:hypothetical protein
MKAAGSFVTLVTTFQARQHCKITKDHDTNLRNEKPHEVLTAITVGVRGARISGLVMSN